MIQSPKIDLKKRFNIFIFANQTAKSIDDDWVSCRGHNIKFF